MFYAYITDEADDTTVRKCLIISNWNWSGGKRIFELFMKPCQVKPMGAVCQKATCEDYYKRLHTN